MSIKMDQKIPVMLHRALFGSLERFIGILIENYLVNFHFTSATANTNFRRFDYAIKIRANKTSWH